MNDGILRGTIAASLLLATAAAGAGEPLRIRATGGAVVDLGGLESIVAQDGVAVEVTAEGAGSRVEMPAMTHFRGGAVTPGSHLQARDGGTLVLGEGLVTLGNHVELRLTETGTVNLGELRLELGALLSGSGALAAPLTNGGTVSPGGEGIGRLAVESGYVQTAQGTLRAELAAGGHDRVEATGRVELDGGLALATRDHYVPAAGAAFTLLRGASRAGRFASAGGLDLVGGSLDLAYEPERVQVRADGPGFLDSDGDGLTDAAEREIWGTDPSLADSDGDGLGDGTELGLPAFDADPATTTDPLDPDTDGDGLLDGNNGTDPCEDCNNNGRVDAGETDPAAAQGAVVLSPGFNHFSPPAPPPAGQATCGGLLAAMGGAANAIERLDAATQRFESCEPAAGHDFAIAAGQGYVMQMETAYAIDWPGEPACTPVTLSPGANLIGHPKPPPGLSCFQWLQAFGSGTAAGIQRFDTATGAFESCTFVSPDGEARPAGRDFSIRAGEAYLVHARAGGEVVLPGCGN